MDMIIAAILGGLVVAYWRDIKFRNWVNAKLFKRSPKKPQADKTLKEAKEIKGDDDKHPII